MNNDTSYKRIWKFVKIMKLNVSASPPLVVNCNPLLTDKDKCEALKDNYVPPAGLPQGSVLSSIFNIYTSDIPKLKVD